jgi:ubiquinone/menaquinone biosynthesis C-methylase UbiE
MTAKYDRIGIDYNQTRKADPYLSSRLLHHLQPKPTGRYLDIGCGTGNYTDVLQQAGGSWAGLDPSSEMLQKAKRLNDEVDWRLGSAENTQLPDAHVDGIVATLTIHHWLSLERGFSEMARILKRTGRLVLFTSTPAQMKGYWLNHYFPKMMQKSMEQMPAFSTIESAMQKAGFTIVETETYSVKPDLKDKFLYCGKEQPKLYLNADIQQGISSFSDLANQGEVKQALVNLTEDIRTGKVEKIQRDYANNKGDYLYVISEKV